MQPYIGLVVVTTTTFIETFLDYFPKISNHFPKFLIISKDCLFNVCEIAKDMSIAKCFDNFDSKLY